MMSKRLLIVSRIITESWLAMLQWLNSRRVASIVLTIYLLIYFVTYVDISNVL